MAKSSYSGQLGNCVDVVITDDEVKVSDTKNPDGPVLHFTHDEWAAFILGVKGEEFELPIVLPVM